MDEPYPPLDRNHRFGRFLPGGAKPLMAMVEVTHRCNMSCPVCFADANSKSEDMTIDQIHASLIRLLEVTKSPIPIQISGGEPTVRQDLPEIISMVKHMGFRNIELITNGMRLAQDTAILSKLKSKGLTAVYLQFDGLQKETYERIRGQDMTATRLRAIDNLRQHGICCTLAVTVTRGINDHEIGDVVAFAIDNIDTVRAINFQSATRFKGRFNLGVEHGGYGLEDLLRLIEEQIGVPRYAFISDPIGHSSCNALSFVYPGNGHLKALFEYIDQKDIEAFLGSDEREKILDLFRGKRAFLYRHLFNPTVWRSIRKAYPIFGSNPLNVFRKPHLLIFAKSFMEPDDLDSHRIHQCCYGITTPQGVFSFCAYNNLHRFTSGHLQSPDEQPERMEAR